MEKNESMAKKRFLKGNNSHYNLFFVLPTEEITNLTYDMGVIIEQDDFDTLDLLKDLETARHYNLYTKQKESHLGFSN